MKLLKLGFMMGLAITFSLFTVHCSNSEPNDKNAYKILFLHHSTGDVIWKGGSKSIEIKSIRLGADHDVPKWFDNYNTTEGTDYQISDQIFPKEKPYGWSNYPYDYYNIWVKNAGEKAFMEEPTLEMLTKEYNMIIFKHCYPVSGLVSDTVNIDINSPRKTIQNYKLQYTALKQKMLQFPETKFIVWTGAVMVEAQLSEKSATLAKSFTDWLRTSWDTGNDNIYLWDFYELETEGGLYLKPEYATDINNSHPNKNFAQKVAPYFCQRIIDVIENKGTKTTLTGKYE
jgi:hypothetical protein